MPGKAAVAVSLLSVAQNGQVTVPQAFRKEHDLSKGGKLMAVRMGDALVMVPHDSVLESICLRLEQAMLGAGVTTDDLKAQALVERSRIVQKRYQTRSVERNKRRN
jgi:bifunctional DNA-binding transcriptional regulator/antitoxin component of YhaV-PrlF toxin-antitoxin module